MELHWIRREGGERLILFVLGWAADYRIVEHIRPDGYDVLAVYDYSGGVGEGQPLRDSIARYSEVWLFAWSFGVWVCERLLGEVEFKKSVALNGTPLPVHAMYGIDPRRMAVTIRGLRAGGVDAFNRRAYGEYYEKFSGVLSPRPIEQNIAELEYLATASAKECNACLKWDKAIVGSGDLIFPPENMVRFWGFRAETLPLPHYPFADGGVIEKEIERR